MSASLKNALVNIAGELDTMTDDDSFTIPLTKMQEFADQFAGVVPLGAVVSFPTAIAVDADGGFSSDGDDEAFVVDVGFHVGSIAEVFQRGEYRGVGLAELIGMVHGSHFS